MCVCVCVCDTKATHGSVISKQNRFLSYRSKTLLSYQGEIRFCHIKAKFTSNSIISKQNTSVIPRQNSVVIPKRNGVLSYHGKTLLSYQSETQFCHTTAKLSSLNSFLPYQGTTHFCHTKAKHVCHIKAKLTSANHNSKSVSLFTANNSLGIIR